MQKSMSTAFPFTIYFIENQLFSKNRLKVTPWLILKILGLIISELFPLFWYYIWRMFQPSVSDIWYSVLTSKGKFFCSHFAKDSSVIQKIGCVWNNKFYN